MKAHYRSSMPRLQRIAEYMDCYREGVHVEQAIKRLGMSGRNNLHYFRHAVRTQNGLPLPMLKGERGHRPSGGAKPSPVVKKPEPCLASSFVISVH